MTNEEIKALLRELSETADAAGVSRKIRITFDRGPSGRRKALREEDEAEEYIEETEEAEEEPAAAPRRGRKAESEGAARRGGSEEPETTMYRDTEADMQPESEQAETARPDTIRPGAAEEAGEEALALEREKQRERQERRQEKQRERQARALQRKERLARKVPVEPADFESDAALFRSEEPYEAAPESERAKRMRQRMAVWKEALAKKGLKRKHLLFLLGVLLAVLLAVVILLLIKQYRAKSANVQADEGLRVLVQKEPKRWSRGGMVTLEIISDEPMQSVTVDENTTALSGEKRTTLTWETAREGAEVMVTAGGKELHAKVDFPKIDVTAPQVRIGSAGDGRIGLDTADDRSGTAQVWYGVLRGLSDVPVYQQYTEPFVPERDVLYACFAKDRAGNQSRRIVTDLTPAQEIALSREEISLLRGESRKLDLQVTPANAFLNSLTWSSSDPKIVSVSDQGEVSALADGEAKITAQASGLPAASCLVKVHSQLSLTISTAGDCTLGEDISFSTQNSFSTVQAMQGSAYFFEKVRPVFAQDDLTFVNLEGTLTDQGTREEKQFAFRGDPSFTEILTLGSVEAVTLANNHSSDYGQVSLEDTKKHLTEAGIEYCKDDEIVVKDVNGVRVGLIGIYVLQDGKEKAAQVEETIARAREEGAQVIVTAFHWGAEMETEPDEVQRTLAHLAIDSGADLVVGHHPHVLQGIEKYSGKYICYSLGNLCFGGNSSPSDMDSMIFQQTFKVLRGGEVESGEAKVVPCRISSAGDWNNYQPVIAEGEERTRIMEKINKLSEAFQVSFE